MTKQPKTCTRCHLEKPLDDFGFRRDEETGAKNYEAICVLCKREAVKALQATSPDIEVSVKFYPNCMHCQKPIISGKDGAYHTRCRGKRNRQADEYAKRHA